LIIAHSALCDHTRICPRQLDIHSHAPYSHYDSIPFLASKMGATASVLGTLIIPAAISLGIYLLLSYVAVPLWQRYRGRYSRYLPLETITTSTTTLRDRIGNAFARYITPSTWRERAGGFSIGAGAGSDDGEELFDVDDRRREALSLDARRGQDSEGRLSRDLEEGFRDDSEDETSEGDTEHGV